MDEAKAKRDYKAEYKKFQSSTKAKKYRAELNKYNRKKGTYGNGDGKDASHKGGKIVGFEAQSKNRGRAEKSRLKKESNVVEGKLESLALNLLRNINKEAGVKKYDHTKTADFNKVMKFLRGKMPKTPDRKLGQIAMSYNDYRKKQPKATIPDIDSVKNMEKTLKKLGLKESVNEAPQEYRVYVKQKAHVGGSASKKFSVEKFQTGGMYFDYKKGMDTIKKLRKMNSTADYKLVKEGVDILNELRIDLPNFDYEKHKRDIFGLFNKLKIKGMLGDRQGKANWLILKDKDDWKKAEPILKKLKIKYKLVNEGIIEMRELKMYIENDGQLYRQRYTPIEKNLTKKMQKGNYDSKLAIKAFMYLVNDGAKKYVKDFGGDAKTMFSKKDRLEVAKEFAEEFETEYKLRNESINKSKLNELDWNQDLSKMSSEIDRLFKMAKIKVLKHIPYKRGYRTGDAALYGAFIHVKDKDGEKTVLPIEIDKKGIIRYAGGPNNWHPLEKIGALNMSHANPADTLKIKTYARSIDYLKQFAKLPGFGQDVLFKKEGINEREMSIKDAFKDLVKDHGSKKALDILTSVLTGGIGFEDPKKKKQFQQKLLKKMMKESKSINETPYELGGMKVYSKADGLKKVKSMQKTDGAKIYKVTKTKTKLYGKHPVTMYNLHTKNKNHSTRQNPYGLDMMKGVYLIPVKESIKEFKNMSPGLKKALAQKGYGPLFFTIDQSKRQLKQMKYTKAEIEDTLFTMFGDQDPKIVKKIKESKIKESINEKKGAWFNSLFPKSKVQKAIEIAKEMGGNMTGATKKIEKFFPGMILNTDVQDALRKYNESINEMTKRQAAETLKQLGGNKFIVMTGAKRFAFSDKGLGFKIGRNAKAVNYVHISLNGKDLYDMKFQKGTRVLKKVDDVYGDQLQKMFTKYTGMYTSLGTMGR